MPGTRPAADGLQAGPDHGRPFLCRPFLSTLPEGTENWFRHLGGLRRVAAGTVLAHEGDRGNEVFVVTEGWVRLTTWTGTGRQTLLETCGPGDLVGEETALDGRERLATVTALTKATVWVVTADRFGRLVREDPAIAGAAFASVVGRLRRATRRRAEFGSYPVAVRVARVLLDLVDAHGVPARDGCGTRIGVALSQKDLGALVGATEISAQRALRVLRDEGVIRTAYRSVTVLDREALARYADSVTY